MSICHWSETGLFVLVRLMSNYRPLDMLINRNIGLSGSVVSLNVGYQADRRYGMTRRAASRSAHPGCLYTFLWSNS